MHLPYHIFMCCKPGVSNVMHVLAHGSGTNPAGSRQSQSGTQAGPAPQGTSWHRESVPGVSCMWCLPQTNSVHWFWSHLDHARVRAQDCPASCSMHHMLAPCATGHAHSARPNLHTACSTSPGVGLCMLPVAQGASTLHAVPH